MREIKFRAWDKKKKEIIPHSKLFRLDTSNEIPFLPLLEKFTDNYTVMQYTGLKDKNGHEIYEGDILESTSELLTNLGRTRTGKYHTSYYKVIWKDDGWGYEVIENNGIGLVKGYQNKGLLNQTRFAKVIGNVYENPELLEESK